MTATATAIRPVLFALRVGDSATVRGVTVARPKYCHLLLTAGEDVAWIRKHGFKPAVEAAAKWIEARGR